MTKHVPVLLPAVMKYLSIQPGDTVLDGTVGSGGYARAITTVLGKTGTFVGIDADKAAIETTKEMLEGYEGELCLTVANFRQADSILEECEVDEITAAVLDLGFRSEQLEMNRGFSFQEETPLVMTFRHPDDLKEEDVTAADVVNHWDKESLASILEGYGNERYSEDIADGIVSARKKEPIETTADLVEIVKSAVPHHYRHARRHPATRTFQAIRIAVNDEIQALRDGIQAIFNALSAGGRLAIVSFHSLEDRTVKNQFKNIVATDQAKAVTDSPITAEKGETDFNPRARSAKLRVIEKCSPTT